MRFVPFISVLALVVINMPACAQPDGAALVGRIETVFERQARGNTHRSADSGVLAWGESPLLETCVWMHRATGDRKWLDRLVGHADSVFSTISVGADRRPGWRTTRYSIAFASVIAGARTKSDARLLPAKQEIWAVDMVAEVTGHTYRVWFPRTGRIVVHDVNTQKVMGSSDVEGGQKIEFIPGVSLKLEGQPQAGDLFFVETVAPKPLDYVVHDGMILTPMAKFIGLVMHDPGLAKYEPAARRYLDIIERRLVHKWDGMWVALKDGGGACVAPDDPAQRFAGCTLPHNQYLALARAFLAVYRANGNQWYRDRAESMGRFFKSNLRLVNDHYEWNYWDPAIPRDSEGTRMQHPEDTSHGHIDVGFAVDAYEAGVVFTREDMERLARTLLSMWNGSMESPAFASAVGGKEGEFVSIRDWIRLGAFDARLREISTKLVNGWNDMGRGDMLAAAQWLAYDAAGWAEARNW